MRPAPIIQLRLHWLQCAVVFRRHKRHCSLYSSDTQFPKLEALPGCDQFATNYLPNSRVAAAEVPPSSLTSIQGDRFRGSPAFVAEKDDVMRTALLQPAAYALHHDSESGIPQALFEFSIFARRPDRQHAEGLEGGVSRRDALVVVHAVIGCGGQRLRSVIHIEHHGIELGVRRTKCDSHVAHIHLNAFVFEGMSGEGT